MAAHRASRLLSVFLSASLSFSLFAIPLNARAFVPPALPSDAGQGYDLLRQDRAAAALFLWAEMHPEHVAAPGLRALAMRAEAAGGPSVDLIDWMRSHLVAHFPGDGEIAHYNRVRDFGGWIHSGADGECYDTRARVLIRDAQPGTVKFSGDNPCVVKSGVWADPYTGSDFKTARSIQIDHVVPLKHAYYSGAYKWTRPQRCHYANFLGNGFHLLAVSGHENMSKGDKSPDGYLPPERDFQCAYVGVWMKIKAIWNLDSQSDELGAIQNVAAELHCDARTQTMSQADLDVMRQRAAAVVDKCNQVDDPGVGDAVAEASGSAPSPALL